MNSDASGLPAADVKTPTPARDPLARTPVVPAAESGAKSAEEVELWWGSCSPRTMMPSFVVCLLLTGLIAWAAWVFVPEGWVPLAALAAASVVWLVQFIRCGSRSFGRNYRLTTRRLFAIRGVRRLTITAIDLLRVGQVRVERSWLECQLHVGRVIVEQEPGPPLLLEGVAQPQRCADLIREAARRAQGAE